MLPYYLTSQTPLPIIEKEQETCENVFSALHELKKLFDPSTQPDIENHVAIKNLGERIAELSLKVHDGLLECIKLCRNTFYPRVVLIPTWAIVHDLFCQFAVDWCAKYTLYEENCNKERKRQRKTRKEDKLLKGYRKCIDDPDYVLYKMLKYPDAPMLCETVVYSLKRAGIQMCASPEYSFLIDEYNSCVRTTVDEAISILAYGIQCFVGMMVSLEKKSESLWILNEKADSSILRQYERYKDKYGEEIFFELLRSFDPDAQKDNLPHITKNQWKRFSEKTLAELLETSVGRECAKGLKDFELKFPIEELECALEETLCNMNDFNSFMKRYYQLEVSIGAYRTMQRWETEDMERISALEFYAQIKNQLNTGHLEKKKATGKTNAKRKLTADTYSYRWLATEEHRIGRLFQMLQNNAHWIGPKESPDDFYALFKGEPKEFHIKWTGKKQHLYHLFKIIFKRGLVTWGRKNGQWTILASHFIDEKGHSFTSFNGEKESIKARATIEKMVDILDPAINDDL